MTPTSKLRFVRRSVPDQTFGENIARYERVLQQWWEEEVPTANLGFAEIKLKQAAGEWRDIPLETE
jgi:hypothetical protein